MSPGFVDVVCTDDGQHTRVLLGKFTKSGDGWQCAGARDGIGVPHDRLTRKGVYRHEDAWSFKCGNCRKHARVSFVDARVALDRLRDMAVTALDVSILVRVLSTQSPRGRRR